MNAETLERSDILNLLCDIITISQGVGRKAESLASGALERTPDPRPQRAVARWATASNALRSITNGHPVSSKAHFGHPTIQILAKSLGRDEDF